ncbi:cell wall-binding repeat-containing protein [Euzebya tangerina]|uniref:cell wall-binding repeat-containing protein n=1 Tax=Euzebya tangerina TaxID=591198 RepID=UPI000E31AE83|nr:cell wall-binding repeat-containing protein [Euzebya tangerina]
MQVFPITINSALRLALTVVGLAFAALLLTASPAMAHGDTPHTPWHNDHAEPSATWTAEGDEYVVDLTFPHPGTAAYSYTDTYDACRSGCSRLHRATDIMTDKMVPIHATVDGEICWAPGIDEPMPSYGYMISLCGDDGFKYVFVHLNNDTPGTDDGLGGPENAYAPGIEQGVRVERGQHIGWVGDSGNAEGTAPHNHFEIHEAHSGDVRINPYNSLLAAEARGDFPESITPLEDDGGPEGGGSGEGDHSNPLGPDDLPDPESPGEGAEAPEPRPETDQPDTDEEEDTLAPQATGRLAGPTRVETAVALSQATRRPGTSRAVVIVPSDSHVEALVAAPLAGMLDAPVLLSGTGGLPVAVRDEVDRLDVRNAYIIGSEALLSSQTEADLAAAGVANIARIGATDRYALSAAVAQELLSYGGDIDDVILALGDAEEASRAWPDALSASALAAQTGAPILLTDGTGLSDAVVDVLAVVGADQVTVVGGTAAISDALSGEAAAAAGASVRRLGGATRYSTSVAVAEAAVDAGLDAGRVWVATGLNYPDALAAGPAAASSSSPLVLVDGDGLPGSPASQIWLARHAEEVVVVGGESAVTGAVQAELIR